MTIPFFIVYEVPKSRWGASHLPNKVPADWLATLNSMRSLWISGVEISLETVFYEPFENIRRSSLPKWMQE